MATMAALETGGTFCVRLQHVSWTASRQDSADGVASSPLWAHVALEDAAGQPMESGWFGPEDENVMTCSVQLDEEHRSDQFDYSQSSRSLPLSNASLVTLLNAGLKITLYRGEDRSQATDELWGDIRVPFLPAIATDMLYEKVAIKKSDDSGEEVVVEVSIQCDANLQEYTLGARVISLHSLAIHDLPKEWTLVAETDEEALRVCAATDRNTANYDVELQLPEFNNDRDRDTIKWVGGKLSYEAPAVESSPGELHGVWSIAFPKAATNKFYEKASIERLLDYLQVEKTTTMVLRRSNVEPVGRVTASITVNLSGLASPGQMQISVESPLKKITPLPKEAVEQELAAATSNDEKKRLQALVNDYENAIIRPVTALSTSVRAVRTRVSLVAEVLGPHPLVLVPPPALPVVKSVAELVTPRDLSDERDQRRDVVKDLRTEIRRVVLSVLNEYDGTDPTLPCEDKRQRIVFKLNSQGAYHQFKERLKKRIVPFIRDQFADEFSEGDDDDHPEQVDAPSSNQPMAPSSRANAKKKRYFAQLYATLMDEVQRVLHETFFASAPSQLETTHRDRQPHDDAKITLRLATLALQALEHEVTGDGDKSEAVHLDRIAYANDIAVENPQRSSSPSLACVWLEYARFCSRQGKIDKAGGALQQSLSLEPHSVETLIAYGALLCDQRDFTTAEDVIKNAVKEALAAGKSEDAATAHALLAFYYSQSGQDSTGNLVLFELLKAQRALANCPSLSGVWIHLASALQELSLWVAAETSLQLVDKYLRPRDVLLRTERVAKQTILGEILSLRGEGDAATAFLKEAIDLDPCCAVAWLVLGRTYLQVESQTVVAIDCLQRALERQYQLRVDQRFSLLVNLGLMYLQSSQFLAARTTFLAACTEFPTASVWLGVGIASLRLEEWDGASIALAEANRLDNSNPEVWGYTALLALASSPRLTVEREQRAKQCVAQALRHQLSNPSLLRELSSCFVAIDRLEDAERLLRRSLVLQDSSLTRKTLADVLAAQNCAEDALAEYKRSLDESQSLPQRCELLNKCASLLVTLGRPEEAAECRAMANELSTPEMQTLVEGGQ